MPVTKTPTTNKRPKKVTSPENFYLPPGIDFEALARMGQPSGGVQIGEHYLPPGIDFAALARADPYSSKYDGSSIPGAGTPLPPTPTTPATNPEYPTPATATPDSPTTIIKTPEELRKEAAIRAAAMVDTDANYLQGRAGLESQLGDSLVELGQQEQFGKTDSERQRLSLERNRGFSQTGNRENLNDRGISMGGVSQQTLDRTDEEYNIQDLSRTSNLQQLLASVESRRAAERAKYQRENAALKANTTENLIKRLLGEVKV